MSIRNTIPPAIPRRQLLSQMGAGFGGIALSALLQEAGSGHLATAAPQTHFDVSLKQPHQAPRAKAVIQLFMHGGPSHVDLLDPKPLLTKHDGGTAPGEVADDENRTTYLLGSPFKFSPRGQSGIEYSELLPHIGGHADRIAVIRSMFTEHRNHEHAIWMAHTGRIIPGRPHYGSWLAYGLGTENQELPAFVSLPDPAGLPVDETRNWSAGWLPPVYQGTPVRSVGPPVLHLHPTKARAQNTDAARLAFLKELNERHKAGRPGELELDARIKSFELAARMQLSATEALNIEQETLTTQRLYGMHEDKTKSYGKRCLMARRLVERGVRFVQILMQGQPWDTHTANTAGTKDCCAQTDLPVSGLLTDLEQRGLLDSTLIVWGGEFGRTPAAEQRDGNIAKGNEGRDHHPYGFSVWLAGGGIQGGQAYGATDDFGYRSVVDRTQTADLHATILHLMGLSHEELVFGRNGRDERLTDVYDAHPIKALLS